MSPEFLVEIPPDRRLEREYALRVLFEDWLGLRYTICVSADLTETRISMASEPGGVTIAIPDVLLARSTKWLTPNSLPPAALTTVDLPAWTQAEGTLPLLYESWAGDGDLIRQSGQRFLFRLDLFGSLVFLLTRYEEYVDPLIRDEHGRFPARASALGSSGWLQWPVLDMYVHVFVGLVRLAWPGLRLSPPRGGDPVIGHDVDHPASRIRWHGIQRFRKVAGDVVDRKDLGLAARRTLSFVPGADHLSRFDPYNTFEFLMRASEAARIRSTFFFLAKDSELPYGSKYELHDGWATHLIADIAAGGHHIGLHGSYNSSTDPERLKEEWSILSAACRGLEPGVLRSTIRQHYLRQQPGETWRSQSAAGIAEDESLGFADAVGYRAGTARSFPAFDLANHIQLPLRIRPLHVMDGTLLDYMALDDEGALTVVAAMSRRTRAFGGEFSVLWHNSSLDTGRLRHLYLEILREMTSN